MYLDRKYVNFSFLIEKKDSLHEKFEFRKEYSLGQNSQKEILMYKM